jgi:hypothetical protein
MDNLNVLVEAKKEYLGQMCHLMVPVMIETFSIMYDEAVKMSKGRKVLQMFQKLLKEVPNWSDNMSKTHSDNITSRCAWYSDLLAAVFVACTKILSAVRLKSDNKKISLKLPTNEIFIQTCYNLAAKDLYKDPYALHENQSEHARDEQLAVRFIACIENSVKDLIPVQQILQTYMSQESRDIDLDGTHDGDAEDPDIYDGEGEQPGAETLPDGADVSEIGQQMGGEEQPIDETMEHEEMEEMPSLEEDGEPTQPSALDNEFRTIPTVQDPTGQQQMSPPTDDGVLFGDAPERRTKKVGYY